jgi:Subtilase family/FG-GAP-like repeat/Peptidase inhibitor I9
MRDNEMKKASAIGIAIVLSVFTFAGATAQGRISGEIRRNAAAIPNYYIVTLKDSIAREDVATLASEIAERYDGNVSHIFTHAIKGFSVQMSEASALSLSTESDVAYVEEDAEVFGAAIENNPPWGLDRIDQRELPLSMSYAYANDGSGVNVYVIDSGIRMTHQEFGGRAVFGYDAVNDGQNGNDCYGHGTHVAAIIGGSTYGVAKGATLHAVRVLNCQNQSPVSRVIAGVEWVTANHIKPAVANLSFVSTTANETLDTAVKNSIATGVTYVVAAGNINIDAGTRSPSRVTEAITVGASDTADTRATFSNYGSVVDLFAPGVDIESAWATDDTATSVRSGTSSAAPFVAGVVARILQANPAYTPAAISYAIQASATSDKIINLDVKAPNLLLYSGITKWRKESDFDGDASADIAIFRPDGGIWQIINSSNNSTTLQQWGMNGDKPVPGDYDGDGKTDFAVFRPSDRVWYIIFSSTGLTAGPQWGLSEDKPVPADYDGDGKTDIAVFRPSDRTWYVLNSSNGSVTIQQWGLETDKPVPADYDGDGKTDIAVFRPSDGYWYIINSSTGSFTFRQMGGINGDRPVPGDYDGDGKTDIACFRPGEGNWYIINSSDNTITVKGWGDATDKPVPSDYDGDGKTDIAVYRPSEANWYILSTRANTVILKFLGVTDTDVQLPSVYIPE